MDVQTQVIVPTILLSVNSHKPNQTISTVFSNMACQAFFSATFPNAGNISALVAYIDCDKPTILLFSSILHLQFTSTSFCPTSGLTVDCVEGVGLLLRGGLWPADDLEHGAF